ncbi:serine/threonine-protein kinase [Rhodopirellula islandica]|uniref:serine/threonine-protein kinase n=1 Tax=Rhodopirellula islandica TaxID=595434 RepID=UPI00064AFE3A
MDSRSLPSSDSSQPDRSAVLPEGSTVHRPKPASQSTGPDTSPPDSTDASGTATQPFGVPVEEPGRDQRQNSAGPPPAPNPLRAPDDVIEGAETVIRAGSSRSHVSATRSHRLPGNSFRLRDSSHASHRHATPASITRELGGQRLNHFLLLDQIGGGGMGAVFRARDEQLGRTVAVKVIPFAADDPDLQRRFRNEAQSAAKLDHPLIARVFDVGNDGPWHYIVFEYIDGANVRDMVANGGPLSLDDALFFTIQVAEAIGHASRRGIVHRDIKPSNVIVTTDGAVKLVDMGLARSDNFDTSEDMTASGVTLGTFDYISPEQARDPRLADIRSDLYSLGCTLFYMLTGSPPFPGGTMLQKLLSHGNAAIPDIREHREDVPAEMTAILNKMLAKLPEQRYQRSETLIADLRELASRENLPRSRGVAVPTLEDDDHRESMRRLRRHLPWMIAATVLLFSAFAVELHSQPSRRELSRAIEASISPDSVESVAPRLPASVGETNDSAAAGSPRTPTPGSASGPRVDDSASPNSSPATVRETTDGGATSPMSNGPATGQGALLPPGQLPATSVGDRLPNGSSPSTTLDQPGAASAAANDPTMAIDQLAEDAATVRNTSTPREPSIPPSIDPDAVISGATPLAGGMTMSDSVSSITGADGVGLNSDFPSQGADPPRLGSLPLPPGMTDETYQPLPLTPTVPSVVNRDGERSTSPIYPGSPMNGSPMNGSPMIGPINASPLTGDSSTASTAPDSIASNMLSPGTTSSTRPLTTGDSASEPAASVDPKTSRPKAANPEPIRVQIVSTEALRVPQLREEAARAGVQLATTLADALQLADELEIDRIDIATPQLVSAPVTIPRSDLILSSSLPGGTEIVFRSTENVDMQRSEMMTIGSHRIEMSGLHFFWTVPATETDGGAMFAINDNRRVRLRDCTVTIDNASRRDDVQAFSVVTDPERLPYDRVESGAVADTSGALPLVSIELSNVIVRGQITMLRMDVAAELQLLWENGLLAVSRRMIEMGGALQPPHPSSGSVRLSLEQLTAITPKGLLQMRMGVSAPYPIEIERRAEECVFVVDTGIPHIELTGIPRVDRDEIWVRLRGSGNAYDTDTRLDDPMLLIRDELGQTRVTTMSDILEILEDPPPWMNERPPRWTVRWTERLPESTPSSRWSPRNFRQDGSVVGGFQERSLPRMPMEPTFDFPPTP